MAVIGYALFDTALGRCGMAWTERGVCALQLPETHDDATRARLLKGAEAPEGEPTPEAMAVMDGVRALLAGETPDLSDLPLDMAAVAPFERAVYDALRQVPPGETVTYGELARRIGSPGAAQAVGRAMGRNPFAPVVPCHRVVAANGGAGGFSAAGGVSSKMRLLTLERAGAGGGLFAELPLAVKP